MPVPKLSEDDVRAVRKSYDALSRGDRATLRRASSGDEMQLEGAFWRLAGYVPQSFRPRLASVVACFPAGPQLRHPGGFRVGSFLRRESKGTGPPKASDALLFRRLLASEGLDQLTHEMRRVLTRLDAPVDWGVLGCDMVYWGDSVRRRWAQDFYAPLKEASDERS
jgi:CRISPR system Cascade subunit CasB